LRRNLHFYFSALVRQNPQKRDISAALQHKIHFQASYSRHIIQPLTQGDRHGTDTILECPFDRCGVSICFVDAFHLTFLPPETDNAETPE
jgi:hypothetical protein